MLTHFAFQSSCGQSSSCHYSHLTEEETEAHGSSAIRPGEYSLSDLEPGLEPVTSGFGVHTVAFCALLCYISLNVQSRTWKFKSETSSFMRFIHHNSAKRGFGLNSSPLVVVCSPTRFPRHQREGMYDPIYHLALDLALGLALANGLVDVT